MQPFRHISTSQPLAIWLRELASRHETLFFLIWKDLKVQYGSLLLGILWSVFQPIFFFFVLMLFFGKGYQATAVEPMPYPVFLFSGIVVWNFMATSITGAIASMQANSDLIGKSAFPRFYLVLTPIARSFSDLLLSLVFLSALAIYTNVSFQLSALYLLPSVILLTLTTVIGLSAMVTVAVVYNRHVRHIIPMLLYAGLFLLPVMHSRTDFNNEMINAVYHYNPVAQSISWMRHSFDGHTDPLQREILAWSVALCLLALGIALFRRMERTLADRV